jgi:AcrR family transcriptional regulator
MYYYVEDREDLVFQCYRRAAEITARHLLEASRAGGTAADVLRGFVTRMLDPNEPEIAARAEIAMLNPTQRDTIQGLYDALATRLAHVLETGEREGVLRRCDVEVSARIILSPGHLGAARATVGACSRPDGALAAARRCDRNCLRRLSSAARLPEFQPLDLAALSPPVVGAFDRDAAGQAKREALLRVASRLFNRKGIDATVARRNRAQVGTTKRTLHHHIGSKQDLVAACYDRAFRIFFLIKDRMLEHQGSRLDALAAAMHALGAGLSRATSRRRCRRWSVTARCRRKGRPRSIATPACWATRITRCFGRESKRAASRRSTDIEARALMLPGLVSWLVKEDVPRDLAQQRHIAREVANLVALGLRP